MHVNVPLVNVKEQQKGTSKTYIYYRSLKGFRLIKSKHTGNRADGGVLKHEGVSFFLFEMYDAPGFPEEGHSK